MAKISFQKTLSFAFIIETTNGSKLDFDTALWATQSAFERDFIKP
jgi:hypothetical protein